MKLPLKKLIYIFTLLLLVIAIFLINGIVFSFFSNTDEVEVSPIFQKQLEHSIKGLTNNVLKKDEIDVISLNGDISIQWNTADECVPTSGYRTCQGGTCAGNTCQGTCDGNTCKGTCSGDTTCSSSCGGTCSNTCGNQHTCDSVCEHNKNAKEATNEANEASAEGEGKEDEAEDSLDNAQGDEGTGTSFSGDAGTSIDGAQTNLGEANSQNTNSQQSTDGSATNTAGANEAGQNAGNLSGESQDKQGNSQNSIDNANGGVSTLTENSGEATVCNNQGNDLKDDNSIEADTNEKGVNEETPDPNACGGGEPVRVPTGEFYTKKIDFKIISGEPLIKIERNYGSFGKESYSFGRGWSFNYDTRLVLGIRPEYEEYYKNMEKLAAESQLLWEESVAIYNITLEKANEAVEFAQEAGSIGQAAIDEGYRAKKLANNAIEMAQNGLISADQALAAAEEALRLANTAKSKAQQGQIALNSAKNKSESAQSLANQAYNLATQAVAAGEKAVREANRGDSSTIRKNAQNALTRANVLKTSVENLQKEIQETLSSINSKQTIVSQQINMAITQITDADNEKKNALQNEETANLALENARKALASAIESIERAEATYQSALQQLEKAAGCLNKVQASFVMVQEMERIKNSLADLTIEAKLTREYSEAAYDRNQYNIDRNTNPGVETVGVGKLILIDETGIPHLYRINEEPDYDSELYFTDGSRNFYPQGSDTTPSLPTDDKLRIMADGTYQVTKKDGTTYQYNYYGKLTVIKARNGRGITFTYDLAHNLTSIEDTFGRKAKITKADGKITKITDPLGREYTYGYTGDNLVSYTDPEGNIWTYKYGPYGMEEFREPDGSGWTNYYTQLGDKWVVDYQEDTTGARYDFSYAPDLRQTIVTNRRGEKETHFYNNQKFSEEIIDADNNYLRQVYDENNNLVAFTDKNGNTTTYVYDQNRNIIRITDPLGYDVNFSYNQFNQVTSIIDKAGNTTWYNYDQNGNLTQISYPDGTQSSFTYNQYGLLISETDQKGNIITYDYDEYGNIKAKTYPDRSKEYFEYDAVGRLIVGTDLRGGKWVYNYNNSDKVTHVINPLGEVTVFTYTYGGKVASMTDILGRVTEYKYDLRGDLIAITDPLGQKTEYAYDEEANITRKVLAEKVTYLYEYDNLDRLITVVNQETGITEGYTYDPEGNIIALINPEGNSWSFTYDRLNRRVLETDPLGNTISYQYTPNNQINEVVNKRRETTRFTYDPMGRINRITDALGQEASLEYDQTGNITSKTDAKGNTTCLEYDCMNRLTKVIDPEGGITCYEYNSAGDLIKVIDPKGNIYQNEYDLLGRLTRTTDPQGGIKAYTYDAVGNLLSFTDQEGVTSKYKYDELNRLVEIEDALGNKTGIGYNYLNKITWRKDALGNKVTYEYDAVGRLITVIDQLGQRVSYEYDQVGNLIQRIDQEGYVQKYRYDALNRLIEEIDAANQKIVYSYDENGNLISFTNPKGDTYQYVYDELDRLVKEVNYQGREKAYTLDANGNLTAEVDFNGNRTTYNYDRLNRLVETLFSDGSKKEFAYDQLGNLTKAVNSTVEERYHYDERSRLVKTETIGLIDRENKIVEFNYDKVGNTTAVITNEGGTARETTYLYDELNRLSQVTLPDGGKVEFRYDSLNRIIERINANLTRTVYTYTPRNELESIVNYGGRGFWEKPLSSYGYLYNARGQRIYQVEGDGDLTTYEYDPTGRITEVYYPFTDKKKVADLKERQYYGLLPQWEKPKKFKFQGIGLGWEEERNLEDQLAEVSEHLIGLSGAGKEQAEELFVNPSVGGLPFVSNLTVEYEVQNKLESLYRQIQQRGGGLNFWGKWFWKEEFTYDPNGNVINKKNGWGEINYTYNESNQLLQAGNRSYQYSLNGNLIREELGASYADYEYSPENRLITARNNSPKIYPDWCFVGEINYAYDALGRKVSKEINPEKGNKGNREYYLYAGLGIDIIQYEMEMHSKKPGKGKNPHDPAGKLTRVQEYYYGNGFLLAAKTIDKPDKYGFGYGVNHGYGYSGKGKGWGNIDPLKDVTFYHQDALGSVVMLTGHNGQVVEKYEYDVYGVAYNGKFDHGLAGMGGNPYGFTGKRYEPETGIYSFAFRDYNPRSIRWMTEDPVKDGMNWYEYCGSDPVNWVDLLGLCGEIIEKAWKAVPDPLAEVEFSIYATQGSMTFIGDENISLPAFGSTTIRIDGTVGVTIDDDDTTRMVVDLDVTANTSTSWSPETDVEMKVGLSANVTVRDDAGTPGNIFDDSVKSQDVPLGILDVTHGLEGGDNNITASTVMRIGNESIIDIQPDRLTVSVELTVGFAPVGAPTFSRGQTVTGNVATIVLDEPGGADTNQIISVDF